MAPVLLQSPALLVPTPYQPNQSSRLHRTGNEKTKCFRSTSREIPEQSTIHDDEPRPECHSLVTRLLDKTADVVLGSGYFVRDPFNGMNDSVHLDEPSLLHVHPVISDIGIHDERNVQLSGVLHFVFQEGPYLLDLPGGKLEHKFVVNLQEKPG